MSTRAIVIIKDEYEKLYFYRHFDGYPEGTMPSLNLFLDKVKSGKIRKDVMQAAGHLILIGHEEIKNKKDYEDWKVGSYEPTTGIHGDIDHLYVIDLDKERIKEIPSKKWAKWEN